MPTKYTKKNSDYINQPKSGKKKPPTGTDADLNLVSLSKLFVDEDAAREWLESKRWPEGAYCPHCGCTSVYKLQAKPESKRPVRPGVYKCKECRKQFTVRIGTIFEESKLPIRKWLMALHVMTSSKKGVSSHRIARELDVTVKTAWFVTHRIREAMKQEPLAGMLGGKGKVLEADEAYVGGKPRPGSGKAKTGRGTKKKPTMVLVERDGSAVSKPIHKADTKSLDEAIKQTANFDSAFMTDEWPSYNWTGKRFKGGHHVINHGSKQYVRYSKDGAAYVSTNTAESFFALIKRGHYGIFHQLSAKHLHRYTTEFAFLWNHRKVTDGERMVAAIEGAEGKRLKYREPRG